MGSPRLQTKKQKQKHEALVHQRELLQKECHALKDQLTIALQQRDDALRQITDTANIEKTVSILNSHSVALRQALTEVEQAIQIVRRLIGTAPSEDRPYLYRGER